MKYIVYILECKCNRLYTGYTTNLERRYQEHCKGKGAKFTRSYPPIKIAKYWCLKSDNVSDALKLEIAIKKLTRKQKLEIIQSNCSHEELNKYLSV
jgi:putative endonuclease